MAQGRYIFQPDGSIVDSYTGLSMSAEEANSLPPDVKQSIYGEMQAQSQNGNATLVPVIGGAAINEVAKRVPSLADLSPLSGGTGGLGEGAQIVRDGIVYDAATNEAVATAIPEISQFGLADIGAAGNFLLPAAGVIGLGDVLINRRKGARGALQGAASGAAIGSYFGPVGTGVGAVIGGLTPTVAGWFGDGDKWKTEQNRLNELRESGLNIPQQEADTLTKGRSKEELIRIEQEKIAAGKYGNPEFARTRDEKLLKPEDIMGYAAPYEIFGAEYANAGEIAKKKALQLALDKGLVREHHGTIDIASDPAYIEEAKKLLATPDPAAAPAPTPNQNRPRDTATPFRRPAPPKVPLSELLPRVTIPTPVGDPGNAVPNQPVLSLEDYRKRFAERGRAYGS